MIEGIKDPSINSIKINPKINIIIDLLIFKTEILMWIIFQFNY